VLLRALWLLFPVAAVLACAAAWNRRRLITATAPPLLILGAFFALALAAKETDFQDADGWIDCWPSCSVVQTATGAGLSWAPALGLLLAAATIVIALVKRRS
jgi:hypothetical protein